MSSSGVILSIVGIIVMLGLFFSYVTGMGKTFSSKAPASSIQSSKLKAQQKESAEDTQMKQRQLMDDIKQKIADNNSRNR